MSAKQSSKGLYLHFGAGNIGRSLAGALFSQAGYEVLFADAAAPVVAALQQERRYKVVFKDTLAAGTPDTYWIERVNAISALDSAAVTAAVAQADVIGTAVGAQVLPIVLRSMAAGLALRKQPVSILFCENMHDAAALAHHELSSTLPSDFPLTEMVGLVETSIGKMVPIMPAEVRQRDPLEVWCEAYNMIIADRAGFIGSIPQVPGLELKENFTAYVERKLYVHNLGHATCACHGHLHGHTYLWSAIGDPAVATETRAVMEATAKALIHRYPGEFDRLMQQEHVDDLIRRFGNRALGDTVYRVGRDLPRKLAPADRFIGGLQLVEEAGGDVTPLHRAIAAALCFKATDEEGHPFAADTAFLEQVAKHGAEHMLIEHCGLDTGNAAMIAHQLKLLRKA
ncbi:MAG: mannitol-1-phosphate 5-dehydrogenase [Lentisphaerae bacterium]|nr:mannitol-1-phosphate 5-dehydrogenase [Lentisphaerota bacterium]